MVERRLAKAEVAGSSPVFRSMFALLAQLVEHLTLNQGVRGSSPRWCTRAKKYELRKVGVRILIYLAAYAGLIYRSRLNCRRLRFSRRFHPFPAVDFRAGAGV